MAPSMYLWNIVILAYIATATAFSVHNVHYRQSHQSPSNGRINGKPNPVNSSVAFNLMAAPPMSVTATAATVWTSLGCYTDNVAARSLPVAMTIEACQAACSAAGYMLAGVEWAQECCEYSNIDMTFLLLNLSRLWQCRCKRRCASA
jgi:hypothetical protein